MAIILHVKPRSYNLSVDRDANAFIPGVTFLGKFNIVTVAGEKLTTVVPEYLMAQQSYVSYLTVLHAKPRDYNLGVTL
jgi:hypothetical protein